MDKIYEGNGKTIETKYGKILKVSFNLEDLNKMHANMNAKGWVNLNINKRKAPSQYGHTHSIEIDTWKPPAQNEVPQDNTPEPTGF